MAHHSEADYLDQAIRVLDVVEALENEETAQRGAVMALGMSAPLVAATSMALLRTMADHWGMQTDQDPMALIQMVRQDLELKRAGV